MADLRKTVRTMASYKQLIHVAEIKEHHRLSDNRTLVAKWFHARDSKIAFEELMKEREIDPEQFLKERTEKETNDASST